MAIERARITDAEAIAALYAEVLPPGWPSSELAAACSDENRAFFKATDTGRLAGFVLMQFACDEAEILSLAVAYGLRRHGHAASLLHAAIKVCQSRFTSCIYLEVAESNEPARDLYGKFGFREIGRRQNYYRFADRVDDALLMRRDVILPMAVDLTSSKA